MARVKTLTLVQHGDHECVGRVMRRKGELHRHAFGGVLAVAVFDRVDDGFAHRHADPMCRVLVEAGQDRQPVAQKLNEVQHFERAERLEANQVAV